MKKALVVVLAVLMLAGCQSKEAVRNDGEQKTVGKSRFFTVENAVSWCIVVDRETKVMYAVSLGTYNTGCFTVLVDADGKPLIWE